MPNKSIQTGYSLGLSLLLTSIFYFFAANWQYFDRLTRVVLSIALLLFFYVLHVIFQNYSTRLAFLGNWLLLAAGIVFGIAVAIIGQVYNSHADNYQLFLVWLIPVLLLAIITKYVPFYVLTFILVHLTIYFFLFPTTMDQAWSGKELLVMLFGVVIMNAIIFYVSYRSMLPSRTILYLAFILFHVSFYFMVVDVSLPLHFLTNVLYFLILIGSFYYWYKIHLHHPLLVITGIFASLFVLYRGIRMVSINYGELALFFLLLFAVALVFMSMLIVGLLNKNKMNKFLPKLITILITMIATLFATLAIAGLFFLIFPEATADVLFFFAFLALIAPGLFTKLPNQVRYTLLGTGFIISYVAGLFTDKVIYFYLLFILLGIGMYVVKMAGIRVHIYLLMNLVAASILVDHFTFVIMYLVLFLLNTGYYFTQTKELATKYTALISGFLHFFILTFLDVALPLQIAYNLAFFLVVTGILLLIKRENWTWEWTVSLVFWFLFLGYKYYEYLWSLVHKSILFLVLGLLLIGITTYLDKKSTVRIEGGNKLHYRVPFLIVIIVLQLGFVSYQAFTNEALLKHGDVVKLELEPVDPRSMMQGDYIQLRYDISDLGEDIKGTTFHRQKIKVVLEEQNGIYHYAGYYKIGDLWNKPYEKAVNDVLINGIAYSPRDITYGIESFFIPDGSGLEMERDIDYAYVRVGESGNAILEKVE